MIVEVNPKDLDALANALLNTPTYAVKLWRGMMETHNGNPCSDCQYAHMIGRKCCCLCLESNLLHAWFSASCGEPVKAAHDTAKSHREAACDFCASASCALG